MPGRKRYDALNEAVGAVQLPTFLIGVDAGMTLEEIHPDEWEALKQSADDVEAKAQDLNEHPHLHGSHQEMAGDVLTAASTFQQMVMMAYNQWRAVPEGEPVKATEEMIGLGSALQFMRSKLGSFSQDKLDASTALIGS